MKSVSGATRLPLRSTTTVRSALCSQITSPSRPGRVSARLWTYTPRAPRFCQATPASSASARPPAVGAGCVLEGQRHVRELGAVGVDPLQMAREPAGGEHHRVARQPALVLCGAVAHAVHTAAVVEYQRGRLVLQQQHILDRRQQLGDCRALAGAEQVDARSVSRRRRPAGSRPSARRRRPRATRPPRGCASRTGAPRGSWALPPWVNPFHSPSAMGGASRILRSRW